MLRTVLLLLFLLPFSAVATGVVQSDSLFLRFVSPERDSIRSHSIRGSFAACTNPAAKVFINGKEIKVYGSGAFVGSIDLAIGVNPVRVARAGNKW